MLGSGGNVRSSSASNASPPHPNTTGRRWERIRYTFTCWHLRIICSLILSSDGVNYDAFEAYADHMVKEGVTGLFGMYTHSYEWTIWPENDAINKVITNLADCGILSFSWGSLGLFFNLCWLQYTEHMYFSTQCCTTLLYFSFIWGIKNSCSEMWVSPRNVSVFFSYSAVVSSKIIAGQFRLLLFW